MRENTVVQTKATVVWHPNGGKPDDRVIFRRCFEMGEIPEKVIATIAAETKYWLYINEKLVVFEGGLFRESLPGCGYADEVDIAEYLQEGENVIAALCWYYGNGGRNNVDSGQAGFLFDCPDIGISTADGKFLCAQHTGYYAPGEPYPAYLYGGHSVGYCAENEFVGFEKADFDEKDFVPVCEVDASAWGKLYKRPVPFLKVCDAIDVRDWQEEESAVRVKLPYAMAMCVRLDMEATGGEVIDIRTDRFSINGGPGDSGRYNGHRLEYVCKAGNNEFESLFYLFGEEILISSSSNTVKINSIGWRETGYNTEIVGSFKCNCPIVNRLVEKSARTLYVCMRDNFMDCPDRERGQWIGDVSVQVPQAFFLLDASARKLVRKSIEDFIHLRRGDVLIGNVPGSHGGELPAQSLCAISEWGQIAQYVRYSGDVSIYEICFEPAVKYLQLWDMQDSGLVAPRSGDWRWFDHLYNIDEAVLENAWYYSALKFAKRMATALEDTRFDKFLSERMEKIEGAFEEVFWNGKFYTSSGFADDRANAMAVLSGLCPKERYDGLADVLVSVSNSTIYMENFVLTALCEMGRVDLAYKRMVSRYYNLAMNENSTLWEDFYILGTKNHAWSGAPATIAFRYFMGIETEDGFETIKVNPAYELFDKMTCVVPGKDGLMRITADGEKKTYHIKNI